jgi:hypothetical protein
MIYLTAIGLTPGGSSTSHISTQTIHIMQRKENLGSAGRAPSLPVNANRPAICCELMILTILMAFIDARTLVPTCSDI